MLLFYKCGKRTFKIKIINKKLFNNKSTKTNTSTLVEQMKAKKIIILKELGKLTL